MTKLASLAIAFTLVLNVAAFHNDVEAFSFHGRGLKNSKSSSSKHSKSHKSKKSSKSGRKSSSKSSSSSSSSNSGNKRHGHADKSLRLFESATTGDVNVRAATADFVTIADPENNEVTIINAVGSSSNTGNRDTAGGRTAANGVVTIYDPETNTVTIINAVDDDTGSGRGVDDAPTQTPTTSPTASPTASPTSTPTAFTAPTALPTMMATTASPTAAESIASSSAAPTPGQDDDDNNVQTVSPTSSPTRLSDTHNFVSEQFVSMGAALSTCLPNMPLAAYSDPTVAQNVTVSFSYRVDTRDANLPSFKALEEALQAAVADTFLECPAYEKAARDQTRRRALQANYINGMYALIASPDDVVANDLAMCEPMNAENTCHVVDGGVTVVLNPDLDTNSTNAEKKSLAAVQNIMGGKQFLATLIAADPNIAGIRFGNWDAQDTVAAGPTPTPIDPTPELTQVEGIPQDPLKNGTVVETTLEVKTTGTEESVNGKGARNVMLGIGIGTAAIAMCAIFGECCRRKRSKHSSVLDDFAKVDEEVVVQASPTAEDEQSTGSTKIMETFELAVETHSDVGSDEREDHEEDEQSLISHGIEMQPSRDECDFEDTNESSNQKEVHEIQVVSIV